MSYEESIRDSIRRRFEQTLADRAKRAASLKYQKIIGAHHFAAASWECLQLYRDGFFLGTIMSTQAVLEASVKFVAKRSQMRDKGETDEIIRELAAAGVLSPDVAETALRVWRHRNDFHHLNPSVATFDLETKAKECIEGLCFFEEEIFGGPILEGQFAPKNPKYYDIGTGPNGLTPVFLRQFDV